MEWINVKNRLPEEEQTVLISSPQSSMVLPATYKKGDFYRFIDKMPDDRIASVYYFEIAHWMPLPERPED